MAELIKPWQYQVPVETLQKIGNPLGTGIGEVASAISSGLQSFNAAKLAGYDIEQHRQAVAPKKMYKATETGYEYSGEIPREAVVEPQEPKTTIIIPEYDDKGQVKGYTQEIVSGRGTDVKIIPPKTMTGMASINAKNIQADPIWQDRARRAASGLVSSTEIISTATRYPEIKAQYDDMINRASKEMYGRDFDMQDLIKREKWQRAVNNQRVIEYDLIARNTINDLLEHMADAKRLQLPFIDKYLAEGAVSMGGVTYSTVKGLKALLIEEIAQIVSAGGVPSDKALELGSQMVGNWNTDEQMRVGLAAIKERLDNKSDIFKAAGVGGGFLRRSEQAQNQGKAEGGIKIGSALQSLLNKNK